LLFFFIFFSVLLLFFSFQNFLAVKENNKTRQGEEVKIQVKVKGAKLPLPTWADLRALISVTPAHQFPQNQSRLFASKKKKIPLSDKQHLDPPATWKG
jgi:hypothetical protein